MKKYKLYTIAALLAAGMALPSCGDSFLESEPTNQLAAGGTATLSSINSGLAATYQILLFDSYANGSYESSVYISDIQSDDVYKGGADANDGMSGMNYAVSQFTADGNHTLSGTWNIYTSGNARANAVIMGCASYTPTNSMEEATLKQYNAEAHFLRAYYTFKLWQNFGNIVFFTEPLAAPYVAPQLTADEVYAQILSDIAVAEEEGVLAMNTNDGKGNEGRISRAAVLMLKAAAVMYQKDSGKYTEVANDMATIIKSGEFDLMEDFADIWVNENEFCKESIFEANHMGEGKTWGNAWSGYGTNLPAYISPSELSDPSGTFGGGWGFGPVRQKTYDMFANGDLRRDASITNWATVDGAKYSPRFQDTGLFLRKYAARTDYRKSSGDVDLNYCNNLRIFRYAETLLNYAELSITTGEQQGVSGQDCLDKVRNRAFGGSAPSVSLTLEAVKAERHYEFVGEGKRYYDLVRWGDAASVLTENDADYFSNRTWTENKKYLPLPQAELDKTLGTEYPLVQNPY
ncbi:MAG: RagB/SusD family nutrient uptake outer membrane protein [Bacteroides sp.]|nr:RagB/SusD family nutrient uptake outer membrane protein [Bacteroides sp.]